MVECAVEEKAKPKTAVGGRGRKPPIKKTGTEMPDDGYMKHTTYVPYSGPPLEANKYWSNESR